MAQFAHRDPSWMHEEVQRLVHRVLELEKENNCLHSKVVVLLKENADLRSKLGVTRDETETHSVETMALQQQAQVLMTQIQGLRDNQQRSLSRSRAMMNSTDAATGGLKSDDDTLQSLAQRRDELRAKLNRVEATNVSKTVSNIGTGTLAGGVSIPQILSSNDLDIWKRAVASKPSLRNLTQPISVQRGSNPGGSGSGGRFIFKLNDGVTVSVAESANGKLSVSDPLRSAQLQAEDMDVTMRLGSPGRPRSPGPKSPIWRDRSTSYFVEATGLPREDVEKIGDLRRGRK